MTRRGPAPEEIRWDEYAHFAGFGWSLDRIAERLGVPPWVAADSAGPPRRTRHHRNGDHPMTDPCPRCHRLAAELAAVRAELAQANTYRTLGGIPRPPATDWASWTPPPLRPANDNPPTGLAVQPQAANPQPTT